MLVFYPKVSQGVRVLVDMKAAGFKPRENHYAFLLREAAGRGAFEEAFLKLQEMVEGGVKPRLRTYTPVLHGLCNKVRVCCRWCCCGRCAFFVFRFISHSSFHSLSPLASSTTHARCSSGPSFDVSYVRVRRNRPRRHASALLKEPDFQ